MIEGIGTEWQAKSWQGGKVGDSRRMLHLMHKIDREDRKWAGSRDVENLSTQGSTGGHILITSMYMVPVPQSAADTMINVSVLNKANGVIVVKDFPL